MKEEEATRCNIDPDVATVITAAKLCPLCLESKVSRRTSLRKTGNFCHVFRESSRKCISDTWIPRKKNPASRKVRERDGEREDRIEHKVTGFWQPLTCAGATLSHEMMLAAQKLS